METIKNCPLAPYTTVKIGGSADTIIITHSKDEFIEALKNSALPLTILGNGSNTLISDSGIKGTVIKNSANQIEYLDNGLVKCDSGVQLPFLITDTINHSFSGLEEFAYIPSTLGGAIFGNIHGANKNNFSTLISEIEVFDLETKNINIYTCDQLKWSYDYSEFQDNPSWVILSVTLKLSPGNSESSLRIVKDLVSLKSQNQPMNSLGSVFKNPQNDSAGRIIDQELNLKGFRQGDAQVSPLHANFIVNLGHATATDYLAIIKKIQKETKDKLNIDLEPEIKFLGNFS